MIIEKWSDSGRRIEREATTEELEQMAKDELAQNNYQLEAALKAEENLAATNAALAHAKSLGFTDAMIAVMYPNLGVQSD